MLSGIALSLTENILPQAQAPGPASKTGRSKQVKSTRRQKN